MIEIKCNKTEKEKIIKALEVMESPCLFPRSRSRCVYDYDCACRKCLETKIKWIVK